MSAPLRALTAGRRFAAFLPRRLPVLHAALPPQLPLLGRVGACGFASVGGGGAPAPEEARPDYYAALGVARTATLEELKVAFRDAAKRYHPDVAAARARARAAAAAAGGGAGGVSAAADSAAAVEDDVAMFKFVNEAYSVLSDAGLRREYDSLRFSRASLLRRRNEGWGASDAEVPSAREAAVAGSGGYTAWTSADRGGSVGGEAEGAAGRAPGEERAPGEAGASGEEVFRASMSRVASRYEQNMKARASMARVNRVKVGVRGRECARTSRVEVALCAMHAPALLRRLTTLSTHAQAG